MKHTNIHELKHSDNGVLVYTDKWGDMAYKATTLQFLKYVGPGKTVLLDIDLVTCTKFELALFFKKCSDLIFIDEKNQTHTQFGAILEDGEEQPMKWFWISVLGKSFTICHDIAFDTTVISKRLETGGLIPIYLGSFFRKRWDRCEQTKSKQAKQAYKTIANLIMQ